jgi:hypothetical protein
VPWLQTIDNWWTDPAVCALPGSPVQYPVSIAVGWQAPTGQAAAALILSMTVALPVTPLLVLQANLDAYYYVCGGEQAVQEMELQDINNVTVGR